MTGEEIYKYAKRKQMSIYAREGREEVMTEEYLSILIVETAKQAALSELTLNKGIELCNKKERLQQSKALTQPLLL